MAISVKFTSYDVVRFGNTKEMIVDDYFKFLEENIKSGLITDCSYDANEEIFLYTYDYMTYSLKLNGNTRNLRRILEFLELGEHKSVEINNERQEKERKDALLEKAIDGEIETDEARQLYVDYLKQQKKKLISSQFNFTGNYDDYDNFVHSNVINIILVFIEAIVFSVGLGGLICHQISSSLAALLCIPSFAGIIGFFFAIDKNVPFLYKTYNFFATTICFIPRLFRGIFRLLKKVSPDIKIIDHKLKWLEEYSLPTQDLNNGHDNSNVSSNDYIVKYLHKLYIDISSLDDSVDKKTLLTELLHKIKEFDDAKQHLKNGELTTTNNEQYIRNAFISYLNDLENRIGEKQEGNEYSRSLNTVISAIEHDIAEDTTDISSNGMVRKRAIGG